MNFEKIEAFFNSDEGKKSIEEYKLRMELEEVRRNSWILKFQNKINKSTHEDIMRFLKWEEQYEEVRYKRGILTHSNLFGIFMDCFFYLQHIPEHLWEDFLGDYGVLGDYVIKTYYGQGSFSRVLYRGEEIFQTN